MSERESAGHLIFRMDAVRGRVRTIHGAVGDPVRRVWRVADSFVTSLPRLRVADPSLLSKKKIAEARSAIRASSVTRSPVRLGAGRFGRLGQHHMCLLLLGTTKGVVIDDAISSGQLWAPPGGWEDLILLRGTEIIAWSITHEAISVFRAADIGSERGAIPNFSTDVEVEFRPLSTALTAQVIASANA